MEDYVDRFCKYIGRKAGFALFHGRDSDYPVEGKDSLWLKIKKRVRQTFLKPFNPDWMLEYQDLAHNRIRLRNTFAAGLISIGALTYTTMNASEIAKKAYEIAQNSSDKIEQAVETFGMDLKKSVNNFVIGNNFAAFPNSSFVPLFYNENGNSENVPSPVEVSDEREKIGHLEKQIIENDSSQTKEKIPIERNLPTIKNESDYSLASIIPFWSSSKNTHPQKPETNPDALSNSISTECYRKKPVEVQNNAREPINSNPTGKKALIQAQDLLNNGWKKIDGVWTKNVDSYGGILGLSGTTLLEQTFGNDGRYHTVKKMKFGNDGRTPMTAPVSGARYVLYVKDNNGRAESIEVNIIGKESEQKGLEYREQFNRDKGKLGSLENESKQYTLANGDFWTGSSLERTLDGKAEYESNLNETSGSLMSYVEKNSESYQNSDKLIEKFNKKYAGKKFWAKFEEVASNPWISAKEGSKYISDITGMNMSKTTYLKYKKEKGINTS